MAETARASGHPRPLAAALAIAGLMLIGSALAQPVSDRVLSRVSVSETDVCATVAIEFNITVRAKSHFPESHGDHVRVDLKPIEVGRVNGAVRGREELRPPASRRAAIQEIQYDGDALTGPVLTVTFDSDRHFEVTQGDDFRSVILRVAEAPIAEACTGGSPALRAGPDISAPTPRAAASTSLHSIPETLDTTAVYALNLLSKRQPIAAADVAAAPAMKPYVAYALRFEEDGVVWNRLRLGFFKTRTEAQKAKDSLSGYYGDSWIVRVADVERESVYKQWIAARRANERNAPLIAESPPAESLDDSADASALVAEAKKRLTDGDAARAIQLLTKAVSLPENRSTEEARELLGIARERNGQLAHAKAEYEEYLKRYPNAEGAARVRQRLQSLLTAGKAAPPELRGGTPIAKWVSKLTASLSQYYQRDESIVTLDQPSVIPEPDKQVNRNALISGADLTARVSNDRFDASLRFSGAHTKDFQTTGEDFGTISAFFLEIADNISRFAARFGRQTRSTGGVLGRFDGALVSFDANDRIRINAVAGAPVVRSRDLFVEQERLFAGGSVDVKDIIDGLDTTAYFIRQRVDDLVDREAAGVELRYTDDTKSAYALVDYDVFYDTLALALFNGSWRLKDDTTLNATFDYRYSPTLMTINALQGQGVETIDELRATLGLTDDDIYYLAESRAARTTTGSFAVTHPFSDRWQINAGATFTNMRPTIDAGGVMGQPGTGIEAYYSAQLLANSLLTDGDLATIAFRYDDMSAARRYVIDVNSRHPVTRRFRINPRLRLSQRNSKTDDQTQYTVKPSIRLNYLPSRRFQLELEGGGEWTRTTSLLDTETVKGYYVIAGYRIDF